MSKNLLLLLVVAYGAAVSAAFFIKPHSYKRTGKRVFIHDTFLLRTSIINNIKKQFKPTDTVAVDFKVEYVCGTLTEQERATIAAEMENFPVRYTDWELVDSFYRKELSRKLGAAVVTPNDLFWLRISQASDKYGNNDDSITSKYIDSLNANIVFLTFDATALGNKHVVVTEKYKVGKSLMEISKNYKYRGSQWMLCK
jgi:hypothetical protein